MIFQILGVVVLGLFYGIYLGKMVTQRRKGIQTNQIAKGEKSGTLFWTEFFMKIATVLVVLAECISIIGNISSFPVLLRWVGTVAAFGGVLIFGISVYTMRDSWRAGIPQKDRTIFVSTGIYRFSRNPAFLGFDLTYFGLLIMFFNPVLLLLSFFAAVMLHLQIIQEELYLESIFGTEYHTYKKEVRRYLGRRKV